MKKITFLLTMLLLVGFSWLGSAQYCAAGPSSTSDSNVEQIDISGEGGTSISYTGCPGVTDVNDQTASSVDLIAGNSYSISITFGTCGGSYAGAGQAWIDYDSSLSYESGESLGDSSGTPGSAPWDAPVVFNFTVPTNAINGTTHLRVMQREGGSTPLDPCGTYSWGSVDEFSINISGGVDPPTCTAPTALNTTNEAIDNADLNWTAADSAVDYNWEVQPQGVAQGTAGAIASGTGVAGTSVNTGATLSAKTEYDFFVQTNCGGGDVSDWSDAKSFVTPGTCGMYSIALEDSYGDGWNGGSIDVHINGALYYDDLTLTNGSGPESYNLPVDINDIISVVYTSGSYSTENEYYIYDETNTVVVSEGDGGVTPGNTGDPAIPSGYKSCDTCPDPSEFSATNETAVGADFSWTVNGTEATWDLYIAVAGGSVPVAGTTPTVDGTADNPYSWVDGTALTDYEAWVRSECDTDEWVGPITFTTLASCTPPTELNVSGKVADEADLGWTDNNVDAPDNGWEYEIVDVTAGGSVTGSGTTTTTNPVHVTGLTVDNDYKFLVRALCDDTTSSDWSAEYAWTQTEVPGCASNPTPIDGADDVPQGTVNFSWNAPTTGGTATSYDLYGGSSAALEYGVITTVTDTNVDLNINGFNTTLFWKIVPKNAGGDAEDACDIWSFTTVGPRTDDCSGYSSDPDPNLDIPDNDTTGLSDTISVAGTGPDVLDDLNVIVYADHTYLGDLEVTLTSPAGTSIILFDNHCGSYDTIDIEFDDNGDAISCGNPTTGVFTPSEALSVFNGESFDGDWVLKIVDGASGDTGTLNKWCLVPTLVSCPTPINLTASNETSTGADLSWSEVGSATVWDVEIGTQGFSPTGTPTDANVANPFIWSAGAEQTTYEFYVRADCAGDDSDVSTWAGPFEFSTIANCLEPSDLTATNITVDSADLGWIENNDPAGDTWNIEWGDVGFTQGDGTMITGTNTNPFHLTGLTGKSTYDYYVQTDCGTSTSPWVGPYTFTTPGTCGTYSVRLEDTYGDGWNGGAVDVYINGVLEINDFTLADGYGPVSVDLPVDIDDVVSIDYTAGSYSTENVYYIYDEAGTAVVTEGDGGATPGDTGDPAIPSGYITCDSCPDPSDLVVSNETSVGADMAWTAHGNETTWDLYIAVSGSATPDASTTPTVDDTSDNPYTWTGGAHETDYEVYVRASCDTDDWVGLVSFTTTAFCVAPDGTATSDITNNSATFNWTDNAGAASDEFEIVYGAPGFDPDTAGTTVSNVSTPYTLTGLTASTDYEWYVRSNCVDDTTHEIGDSDWSSVNAFTTLSNEVLDWYNLQWPSAIEMTNGGTIADTDTDGNGSIDDPINIYAQAYEAGVTNDGDDPADAGDGIQAWIGYGPVGSTPDDSWTWIVASYNIDSGSNDEYVVNLSGANQPNIGTWDYASRFQLGTGIYTYGGTGGAWDHDSGTITIHPIPGDMLCDALPITVNAPPLVATNEYATSELNEPIDASCFYGTGTELNNNTVWFSFVAPDSGNAIVSTDFATDLTDTQIAIYSMGDCSDMTTLVEVGCDEDGGVVQTFNSIAELSGLTAGTTYYIQVDGYNDNVGEFNIVVTCACTAPTTTWDGIDWDNGVPTVDSAAVLDADYIGGDEFTACNLTITANGSLYVSAGETYTAVNDFVNNGEVYIENTGSFIQMSGEATVSGAGTFTTEQITSDYVEYDYTYFSSPSSTATVTDFTDAGSNASYIWELNTAAYNDADGDTYDDDGQGSEWVQKTGALTPGVGYAVLGAGADIPFDADDIDSATTFSDTVEFNGPFNTGDVVVTLVADNDAGDGFTNQNLIGNPYPSAIDIDAFYNANSGVVSPTFYYWTHNTQLELVAGVGYVFTNDDYAVWTVGTGGAASGGTLGASQYVASCQGFLANAENPGAVTFTNAMRVVGNNTNFMSPATSDDDKLWINMRGNGDFRQVLVGFFEGATDNFEAYYDGPRMPNGSNTDFYTVIEGSDAHYAIQGLSTFNNEKVVPLGLEIVEAGDYTFEIDNVEGVFATGQVVYIFDNYTGIYHNLTDGAFTFTTSIGEAINDRFELRFTDALATDISELDQVAVYPNPSKDIFNISWRGNTTASLQVYDLSGKVILEENEFDSANRTYQLDMSGFDAGVYFVKLNANDRQIVKKLVLK